MKLARWTNQTAEIRNKLSKDCTFKPIPKLRLIVGGKNIQTDYDILAKEFHIDPEYLKKVIPLPIAAHAARPNTSVANLYTRFPFFDGIRAISIFWVVLHHITASFPGWFEAFKARGFLGVELFFSISGFLVTRSLDQCFDRDFLREPHPTRNAAHDFIVRRLSRIFPPYFLLLGVILPTLCLLNSDFRARVMAISDILWSFPLFLSNYFIPSSKEVVPNALAITWSLSFEEQFYLTLLSLSLIAGRKRLPIFLACAGIGSLGFRLITVFTVNSHLTLQNIQMPLHMRFDALIWACLAWIYFDKLGWLWAEKKRAIFVNTIITGGIIATVTLTTWYPDAKWQAIIFAFTAPLFSIMVRALCEPQYKLSVMVRALSNPLAVMIGMASYEIYLVHATILGPIRSLGLVKWPFVSLIVGVATSFALGWAIHRYFSKPIEKWMRARFAPKQ